jgi:hypothetical protein
MLALTKNRELNRFDNAHSVILLTFDDNHSDRIESLGVDTYRREFDGGTDLLAPPRRIAGGPRPMGGVDLRVAKVG